MIKSNKAVTYIERLFCDKCGEEMKQDDLVFCTYPAQYCYFCPKCGSVEYSIIKYPNIVYKEVKGNAKRN